MTLEELDALRTLVRDGMAAHEKRMNDFDQRMAERVAAGKRTDEGIEKLVSAI